MRYIYCSQHFFGKERLKTLLLKIYRTAKRQSNNLICSAYDGRKFRITLYDRTYDNLYFTGYFEKTESRFIEQIVKEGDVILDIGANFGWYTTLCSKLCGTNGEVHAFEPVPTTLVELRFNLELNNTESNVLVNNFALGSENKRTEIFLFEGLPHSHASLSNLGRHDGRPISIQVKTMDEYASQNLQAKQVRFIKLDVEGAEINVLNGAKHFFEIQKNLWLLFEINVETSNAFGYDQKKLFATLKSIGFKHFYQVSNDGSVKRIHDYNSLMHGDNVFCHKQD